MKTKKKNHWVEIAWGGESTQAANDTAVTYEYSTQAELDAFMDGVTAVEGWEEFNVVDSSDPDYKE